MPDYVIYALILIGLAATVALIWFIRKQWNLLQQHQALAQSTREQHEQAQQNLIESLRVLSLCILDEQIELSEACIRIKVLIDNLAPEWHSQPELAVFNEVYDALSHMPTHETRLNTDKRFLFKMDQQRFKLESEKKEAILSAARSLHATLSNRVKNSLMN